LVLSIRREGFILGTGFMGAKAPCQSLEQQSRAPLVSRLSSIWESALIQVDTAHHNGPPWRLSLPGWRPRRCRDALWMHGGKNWKALCHRPPPWATRISVIVSYDGPPRCPPLEGLGEFRLNPNQGTGGIVMKNKPKRERERQGTLSVRDMIPPLPPSHPIFSRGLIIGGMKLTRPRNTKKGSTSDEEEQQQR